MERRLTAVLAADVVGYSRLMGANELRTFERLKQLREQLVAPTVANCDGRVVKLTGDGFLAEFASAAQAVRCAIELQGEMARLEAATPEKERIVLRIGINLGDVILEDGDIYGDGVNVAARLEGMAEPGGVLISHSIRENAAPSVQTTFFDNGERKFKNIERPIRVWSWPKRLTSLRAEGKPQLFLASFEGRGEVEQRFANDLGHELRSCLARLTGLELTANRARAHYVLEGAVHVGDGRHRIFARLLSSEEEKQIWSERYDERCDSLFDVLDRCAPRVAMSVRRRVAAADAQRLAGRPLDELSVEELLALAGISFFTPTKEGWRGGGVISEQILELQPKNFMALMMAGSGLGTAEFLYGFGRPEDTVLNIAIRRVEEAVRLNNKSDVVHTAHSLLLLFGRRRHADAKAAALRSLELNPDFNMAMWALGATQVFSGDFDAGAESAMRAVGIESRDPYVHLYSRFAGYGHLDAGRFDEARAWFQRANQLAPAVGPNLAALAVACWREGDHPSARHAIAALLEEEPDFSVSRCNPLPYRTPEAWLEFAKALRAAGAPD
ncbi:pH-sensitive adenylate cyclase [Bradyrhizobium ivorense]|uniref:PH-sensitive adenylate cyclase n=1 Tax=Bradyrhizobium ivorense TaxID=2511166 RepID=A0A508SUM0_9BRAD|nr:adenylate/guanylate cyclase domain-containing protein [Bradyrhizobium ivorense]VIO65706.1 pH-sensitive adenylate cyclase [Bradyrhizobium ivorense]